MTSELYNARVIMEKLMLFVVLFSVVSAHKYNPKFPKRSVEFEILLLEKATCTSENRKERVNIIEQSKCGTPRDVFVYLDDKAAYELISPGAVWVKRCVGLCEYDGEGSCIATMAVTSNIPVRIYNAKTNKETCATYHIEEHVSCGCCALPPDQCAPPRIFNPRKCSCQCPNMEERRNCLKKYHEPEYEVVSI